MNRDQTGYLFYSTQIADGRACLNAEETRHAVKVLRHGVGDFLEFTDGKGVLYRGQITDIGHHETWLEIESSVVTVPLSYRLQLAVAPTKRFERMAWCVEKLTELGVQTIIPLLCARAERQRWNMDRIQKVMISAMKQSRHAYLPHCTEPVALEDLVHSADVQIRYIATQRTDSVAAKKHYRPGSDVMILIGPEGDFTDAEVSLAVTSGFTPLSLGDFRLRTETAAIVAAAGILTLNQ